MHKKGSKSFDTFIKWGDSSSTPISEYQKIYDELDNMTERDVSNLSEKNPMWKNMLIVNNAMMNTATSYVSPIKPPNYELYKQHTARLAR